MAARLLISLSLYFFLFFRLVSAEIVPLTILHTNDLHAHLLPDEKGQGGAAIIAGYYRQARNEVKNVLILDAGDLISGTPVSSLFKGDPIFHVLNHWGISAAALGNHDFDYGWERIERFREIAEFPLLCANAFVLGPDGMQHPPADEEYHIFTWGALRVGVIGVIAEWTPQMTTRDACRGVTFVSSIPALQRLVPTVAEKSDLVVVLSHVGIEHDQKIAEQVPRIHLIVGGHSHTRLAEAKVVNGIPIVQTGSNGRFVGRIDLAADTKKKQIVNFAYRLLPVDKTLAPEDPETAESVKQWEKQVGEIVDRPLGTATENLSSAELCAIAEAAFLEAADAEYAYQNPGGTRGTIPKGAFTLRAVWNVFPFENTLVTAELQGKAIPAEFHGHRPIDPERKYRIVTNSFVRDQWRRNHPDLAGLEWTDTGLSLRDSVVRYIERRKTISPVVLER